MLDELGLSRGLTAGGKSYFQQDDFCKIGMKKKRKENRKKSLWWDRQNQNVFQPHSLLNQRITHVPFSSLLLRRWPTIIRNMQIPEQGERQEFILRSGRTCFWFTYKLCLHSLLWLNVSTSKIIPKDTVLFLTDFYYLSYFLSKRIDKELHVLCGFPSSLPLLSKVLVLSDLILIVKSLFERFWRPMMTPERLSSLPALWAAP